MSKEGIKHDVKGKRGPTQREDTFTAAELMIFPNGMLQRVLFLFYTATISQ